MRNFALLISFGALTSIGSAAIVIDDFTDAQGPLTVNEGQPQQIDRIAAGGAIGGSRALYLGLLASDYKQNSTARIQNGAFGNNEFGNASNTILGYFSTSVANNNTFWYSTSTNYDFAGNDTFKFNMLGNDAALGVEVLLIGSNTTRTYSKTFAAGGSRTETIGVGDITFDGGVDMSAVDFMWISFNAPRNGDFGIADIQAVPEPASMAVIGLGLAAIARRRKA